jgi:cytochrome c oxidase subunit 1
MGMLGMPRRYSNFGEYEFLKGSHGLVLFVTVAAIITVVVQLVFYFNFIWSIFKGKKAPNDNPWEATTLEWTIPSPPPHDNFAGVVPTVYHGPYEFLGAGCTERLHHADRAGRRGGFCRPGRYKREWRQRPQTLIRLSMR